MRRALLLVCITAATACVLVAATYVAHRYSFRAGGTAAYVIALAIPLIAWVSVRAPFSGPARSIDWLAAWMVALGLTVGHYLALEAIIVRGFNYLTPVEFLGYRAAYMAGAGAYAVCWSLTFLALGVSGRRK